MGIEKQIDRAYENSKRALESTGVHTQQGNSNWCIKIGVVTTDNNNGSYGVNILSSSGSVARNVNPTYAWGSDSLSAGDRVLVIFNDGLARVPIIFSGGSASGSGSNDTLIVGEVGFLS